MVIYNANIIMQDIPLEAYDYVVNGKPALDWVIERQVVKNRQEKRYHQRRQPLRQ